MPQSFAKKTSNKAIIFCLALLLNQICLPSAIASLQPFRPLHCGVQCISLSNWSYCRRTWKREKNITFSWWTAGLHKETCCTVESLVQRAGKTSRDYTIQHWHQRHSQGTRALDFRLVLVWNNIMTLALEKIRNSILFPHSLDHTSCFLLLKRPVVLIHSSQSVNKCNLICFDI